MTTKREKSIQLPLANVGAKKRQSRSQLAALCYRIVDGKMKFLLITSRRSRRWIIPKGWPEWGITPGECASKEAYEEAGVRGQVGRFPIGAFSYIKKHPRAKPIPFVVMVYPLEVTKLCDSYPESTQRKRKWVGRKTAAQMVREPELQHIMRRFKPHVLSG